MDFNTTRSLLETTPIPPTQLFLFASCCRLIIIFIFFKDTILLTFFLQRQLFLQTIFRLLLPLAQLIPSQAHYCPSRFLFRTFLPRRFLPATIFDKPQSSLHSVLLISFILVFCTSLLPFSRQRLFLPLPSTDKFLFVCINLGYFETRTSNGKILKNTG